MLNVVTFRYIADSSKEINYGMIAEEVVDIFKETIVYDKHGNIYTIQYHKFIPLLIKQVQMQQSRIDNLKLSIKTLVKKVHNLEKKLGKL
jgi:hypothetical protein